MNVPVALRELRVAAQRAGTYRSRMYIAAAGVVGMIWALVALSETGSSPHLIGQVMFTFGAWAVFTLALGTFAPMSDAISSEKRGGTLGLLFLTHLRGRDVVLGKLASNGLNSLTGLVALFPILTVPVILGGIEFSQCARLFLSVGNIMFLSAAAGLLASTVCVQQPVAQSKAVQMLLVLVGAGPLGAMVLRRFSFDPTICLILEMSSPLYAQKAAFGALLGPQLVWFSISLAAVFAMSCSLLALASWLAPRCWQERAQMGVMETIGLRLQNAIRTNTRTRSPEGRQLLDQNPYQWLAIRDRTAARFAWITIGAVVSVVAILCTALSFVWLAIQFSLAIFVMAAFMLILWLKLQVGGSAVRHIAAAKENGGLEMIMASSLSVREIIAGQFRAARHLFLLPLLACTGLLGVAFFLALPSIDLLAYTFTEPPEVEMFRFRALMMVVVAVFFLFADCFTITWVGLCCAFRCATPLKARSWTGFWMIALPLLLVLVGIVVSFQLPGARTDLFRFYPFLLLWMGMKLVVDLVLVIYCRAWLHHAARESMAAPAPDPRSQNTWPSIATIRRFVRTDLAMLRLSQRRVP